jgi:uncharacterized protein involved in exopolysaccharide biosynthesis
LSPADPFAEPLAAPPAEPGGQIDLRDVAHRLRRRWKLVALAAVLAVGVGAVQYLVTPKLYRAEAIIQIERRSLTPFTSSQTPWLENWWNMEYYPTQYRLLESRGLAERVVTDLRLMDDPAFNPAAGRVAAGDDGRPSSAADRAVLGGLANRLRGGLSVQPIQATQLVRITYQSSSPELAARVANGFAQTFIEWGIESRTTTVGKASSFLGQQIDELKREIADREGRLQTFSRDEDIVNFQPESNVVYQRLQALNADHMQAVRQRIERQARYEELAAGPEQAAADTQASGLVSDILREQLELERQYENQLSVYKPDWPPMRELKAKIDQGRQRLDEVVKSEARRSIQSAFAEYQTALRQEQKLASEIERAKGDAMDQNLATVEFSNLQVEITTRRELLDELLRKRSETDVAARLQDTRDSNVRVVDEALVPGGPFRPSLRNNLSMGLFAGLLLGIGAVFLVEYMDRSIKTSEELERILGLPVLAVIPDVSAGGRRYGYA